jgi:hypothetical protein
LKKNNFNYLFPEKKTIKDHLPSKNAKKVVLIVFTLFLLLYIEYKPYSNTLHHITGITEYLFGIYQFIINQTLGIVHEGGHGICYILPCPQFIMVINGTLFQWIFPLGIAYYYKKQGNQIAFYMGLFILGNESLISGITRAIGYLFMVGAVIGMFFEAFSSKGNKV